MTNKLQMDNQLRQVKIKSLLQIGNFDQAESEAKDLVDDKPTSQNYHLYIESLLYKGDEEEIVRIGEELLGQAQELEDPFLLLRVAHLLPKDGDEGVISKRLWEKALEFEIDTPQLIASAVTVGTNLGLDDSDEMKELFQKMRESAGEDPDVLRAVSLEETKEMLEEQKERNREILNRYYQGKMPLHFWIGAMGTTLPYIFWEVFDENTQLKSHWKTFPIMNRHGTLSLTSDQRDLTHRTDPFIDRGTEKFVMDMTSLLIGWKLEVIEHIEQIFETIKLPKSAILFLQQQAESESKHQPIQKENFERLSERIKEDEIKVLDASESEYEGHDFQDVKDIDWIHMAETAKKKDGVIVEYLPVRDDHGNLTEIKLGEYEELVVNNKTILKAIYESGEWSEEEYETKVEDLGGYGEEVDHDVLPSLEDDLYFGGNTIEQLERQGILESVLEYFPNVFITNNEKQKIEQNLKRIEQGLSLAGEIETLIDHIQENQPEKYQFLELAEDQEGKISNEQMREPNYRVLVDLLTGDFSEESVVCTDDRYVSGHGNIQGNPIVGMPEVLKKIRQSHEERYQEDESSESTIDNFYSEEHYYRDLIYMREADLRYLPVDSEEILYWLNESSFEENRFGLSVEGTDELEVLRRYVSGTQIDKDNLQFPSDTEAENSMGEVRYTMNLFHEISAVLIEIWSSGNLNKNEKRAYSNWIFSNLFVDMLGIRRILELTKYEQDDLVFYGQNIGRVMCNAIQITHGDSQVESKFRKNYLQWLYNRMLAPRELNEGVLINSVGEAIREFLISFLDEDLEDESREKTMRAQLQRFFRDLPVKIQKNINLAGIADPLALEPQGTIEFAGFEFKPNEIWPTLATIVNRESEQVELQDRTGRKTFLISPNELDSQYEFCDSIKFVDQDTDEEFTFESIECGFLSRDEGVIEDVLEQTWSEWFDRDRQEFEDVLDELLEADSLKERMEQVHRYREKSLPFYHFELQSQASTEPQTLKREDFIPPEAESFRNFLRYEEVDATEIDESLEEAARKLINQEGLEEAFHRFAHLPKHFPAPLYQELQNLSSDDRVDLLQNLSDQWASAVRLIHLFNLVMQFQEDDPWTLEKAEEILDGLLNPDSLHTESFMITLKWVNRELNRLQYHEQLTKEEYLLANWIHASQLQNIILRSGINNEQIFKHFRINMEQTDLLTFDRDFELWNDVAYPREVKKRTFLFMGLFSRYEKFPIDLIEDMDVEEELVSNFMVGEEDERSIHPEFMNDPSLGENALNSFLGRARNDVVEETFGEDMGFLVSSDLMKKYTRQALNDVIEEPGKDIAWTLLNAIVGHRSMYPELRGKLLEVIEKFDFDELFEIEDINSRLALEFFGTQIGYLDEEDLRKKLFKHLKKRAEKASEETDKPLPSKEDNNLTGEAESIVEALLSSSISEGEPEESASRFGERMEEIVRIWPEMAPLFRDGINKFVWYLPIEQAAPLWRLNLVLRSCY